MQTDRTWPTLAAGLLALGLLLPTSPGGLAGETTYWSLAFENDTPKQLVLEDTGGRLRFYWYLVYRVKNPESRPLVPRLKLSMRLALEKQVQEFDDGFDLVAETHIERKVLERPACNWAEMRAEPLKPGATREGLAIFAVGREAPDFDKMTIFVHGLAELRPLGREGNVRKFRERVLQLRYEQVPSRWRAGKELKYLPEEWTLEEVSITDRAAAEGQPAGDLGKKLQELLKRAEEERKRKALEAPPPPPPKASSTGPPGSPAAPAAPVSGRPAPDLLKALRKTAAGMATARATFTEAIGRGERTQPARGSISLASDGRFAIERNLQPGSERTIKESRVFDGQHLWVQTTAKGMGETVRRWTVAGTKKEWHAIDGKPEVDFATVANPARAWRLFGDDLVYLGTERLGRETAYVFEVRPDKKYEAVLDGPLAGELLGKALGHRVRFWLGASSAFQLRMQVRDDRDQVIAQLDCDEVTPDAVIPPEAFAFTPPAGIEVIDMNAAFVANDKR